MKSISQETIDYFFRNQQPILILQEREISNTHWVLIPERMPSALKAEWNKVKPLAENIDGSSAHAWSEAIIGTRPAKFLYFIKCKVGYSDIKYQAEFITTDGSNIKVGFQAPYIQFLRHFYPEFSLRIQQVKPAIIMSDNIAVGLLSPLSAWN